MISKVILWIHQLKTYTAVCRRDFIFRTRYKQQNGWFFFRLAGRAINCTKDLETHLYSSEEYFIEDTFYLKNCFWKILLISWDFFLDRSDHRDL